MDAIPWMLLRENLHTQAIRAVTGPTGQPRSQQCTITFPTAVEVIAPDSFPLWGLTDV